MRVSHFKGKEILITGGTGSLGKELVKQLRRDHRPRGVRVYSRDELKQYHMQRELDADPALPPVAFLLGDVRDCDRLRRAMTGVDIVIHAAALKQVPACESNPLEAIRTNIHGAENVLGAAIDCVVEKVMNVSTDKAVKPVNIYGAAKMAAERLFTHGGVYASGSNHTKFASCRYGNVLGSRGSVAHVFKAQADSGQPITITHNAMTRFFITLPTVARFLLNNIGIMQGGEVFVPRMKSMSIHDMAIAMGSRVKCTCKPHSIKCPWCDGTLPKEIVLPEIKTVGIRQGEKIHESLFAEEEYVYEFNDHYRVFPARQSAAREADMGTPKQWEFNSSRNPNGELTQEELLDMLNET
jgi:UDP-N-acetylglucosamine 4,6-dehydratase